MIRNITLQTVDWLQVKRYLFYMPSGEERTDVVPDPPPVETSLNTEFPVLAEPFLDL